MATAVQNITSAIKSGLHATTGQNGVHTAVKNEQEYSAQHEAHNLLVNEIIQNPLMESLPAELKELSKHVKFEGSPSPSIPINWRFAESIA